MDDLQGVPVHRLQVIEHALDLVLGIEGEGHVLVGQLRDRALGVLDLVVDHVDVLADGGGKLRGAGRQRAHFIGDHGEAAAALAGSGGLDGSVEGEQVGLLGDGVHVLGRLQDLGDLQPHLVHAFHQLLRGPAGFQGSLDEQAEGLLGGPDEVLEVDAFVDLAAPVVALDQRMGQAALGIDAFGEAVEAVAELADRRMQQFVDLPGVTVQLRGFVGERPLRRAPGRRSGIRLRVGIRYRLPRGAQEEDEHGQAGEPTERQDQPDAEADGMQPGAQRPG
ncbi:Uncharacterised protein [Klebsiella pneumoniae]|nr:Uncharacterised protein [Klebsiella pneumoniae]